MDRELAWMVSEVGEPAPHRPATDVAFAVARWFARGGSFVSYYMAFGGSNFGRSVGRATDHHIL